MSTYREDEARCDGESPCPQTLFESMDPSSPVIDIKDFEKEGVLVSLDRIEEPRMPSRVVSDGHVDSLRVFVWYAWNMSESNGGGVW